jgi:uncharacterized LabA/DUF88 family protein
MTALPRDPQPPGVPLPENVRTAVPRDGDVALLVDWENLKWGLREHFRVAPNITSLIAATREFGRLVIARAYADWTQPQLSIDAPNLHRATIEPVYAQGRHQADGRPFKNSADVRLAVDTVALSTQLPHLTTFVLVTGDGDLVHPINYLRLNGKRVVVIAVQATMSTLLESAADAVLVYERDVEPLEEQRIPPPERAQPVKEAIDRLARWLPLVLAGTRTKQSFTTLNEMLLSRFGFNPRAYGVSFKELMLEAEKHGVVQISTEGSMDFALLPGTETATLDFEAEEDAGAELPVPYLGDVRFEHLDEDDQRTLVYRLDDLEESSRFLTVKYLVDRLSHTSVLPTLSETQLKGLLLRAIESGIFEVDEVPAVSPQNGERFMRRELHLNTDHPAVAKYFTEAKEGI